MSFPRSNRKINLDSKPKENFKTGPGSYIGLKDYQAFQNNAPFNSSLKSLE